MGRGSNPLAAGGRCASGGRPRPAQAVGGEDEQVGVWPRLNGKVERSHRTDKQEFYQLLTYTGDVDLNAKLAEWERFYNYQRPHGAFRGKTPYEALREKLG